MLEDIDVCNITILRRLHTCHARSRDGVSSTVAECIRNGSWFVHDKGPIVYPQHLVLPIAGRL